MRIVVSCVNRPKGVDPNKASPPLPYFLFQQESGRMLLAASLGVGLSPLRPDSNFPLHAPCEAPTDLSEIARMLVTANVSVPTTGTHTIVGMCQPESKDFDIMCSVHKTNVERYVAAHASYGFSFFTELPAAAGKRDLTWYKIPALYKTLSSPGVEFAFWMDSDSLFMTLHKPLPEPSPGKFLAVSTHQLPRVRARGRARGRCLCAQCTRPLSRVASSGSHLSSPALTHTGTLPLPPSPRPCSPS